MWRVVVAVLFVLVQSSTAENEVESNRVKRSPYPPCYPPPPPHWHHHWRHLGPPPPYWDRDDRDERPPPQVEAYSQAVAQTQPVNQPQPYRQPQQNNQGPLQEYQVPPPPAGPTEPCTTCKGGPNSAVSNAQSGTGNAVAIAVNKGNRK